MEFLSRAVLADIGALSIIAIVLLVATLFMGLVLAYLIFKRKGFTERLQRTFSSIILRVILFIFDSLYIPSKRIVSLLGGNDLMIDHAAVETRNILLRKEFSEVPYSERIVILPQCLRSLECKTSFSSVGGAICLRCGKCKISKIVERAERLGYKGSYIAPGGGFVKRIIKTTRPKAVLGIACPYEVNMGLLEVSNQGIPVQGITLSKTGCVETDVDLEEVFSVMELLH